MTGTGRLHEVRAVIEAVRELPAAERASEIEHRCAGDPELRREVDAVLDALDDRSGFLTPPSPGAASDAYSKLTGTDAAAPDNIPGYRILGTIGEGGMGVVYEAEQEHPRRRVALKVMRSALPTEQLLRRFNLESEVLARLQHPGIAQIYGVGTYGRGSDERPFFAMEFIEGKPLTDFARDDSLSTRDRVELLIALCEAVEHAHQKGVIHRDLKPSNILVTGEGRPKILDFGVARSVDADIQATAIGTTQGQIIGTLAYMSPEQLRGDPSEVDTRADVYALGVIAYELLAGRRPHDLTEMPFPEAIRAVSDDEPPSLATLQPASRGDLSTIVHKAMERDHDRRYQTASMLAADLTHYLNREPILARPPTTMYRVRKFTARNPALVGGVAAVFCVLVAGIIATSATAAWALDAENQAIASTMEAERNAAQAEREAAIADAINAFLNDDLLAAVDPRNTDNPEITMREVLDRAADRIEGRFEDEPLVESRIRMTLGVTYQNLGLLDDAVRHSRRGVELFRRHNPPGDLETLSYANSLASTLLHRGDYDEAAELLEALVIDRKKLAGPLDEIFLVSATNLAAAYMKMSRLAEAEPLIFESLDGKTQTLGPTHERTLTSMNLAANLLFMTGRFGEAATRYEQCYEGRRETLGEKHPATLNSMSAYATALTRVGRADEAATMLERCAEINTEVHGPNHPSTIQNINALAMNATQAERFDDAIGYARTALERGVVSLGKDHPQLASYRFNLARALAGAGRHDEAIDLYIQIEQHEAETLSPIHWYRASTFCASGESLLAAGRFEEAAERARDAYSIFTENFGTEDARTIGAGDLILRIAQQRGDNRAPEGGGLIDSPSDQ